MNPRLPRKSNRPVRLTDAELRRMRDAYADGVPAKDLARRFGISVQVALDLLRGRRAA